MKLPTIPRNLTITCVLFAGLLTALHTQANKYAGAVLRLQGNWFLQSNTNEWVLGFFDRVAYFEGGFGTYRIIEEKQGALKAKLAMDKKEIILAIQIKDDSTITVNYQGRNLVLTNRRRRQSAVTDALWNNQANRADDTVRLKGYIGKVANGRQQQVELYVKNPVLGKSTTHIAKINTEGVFGFSFPMVLPYMEAFLRYEGRFEHFVVCPGDTITVCIVPKEEAAASSMNEVAFGGTLGALNNEFNAAYKHLHTFDDYELHKQMVINANQDEYREYVMDMKNKEDSVIAAYERDYTLSPAVRNILEKMTHYKVPNELLRYRMLRNPSNPEPIHPETMKLVYSFVADDSSCYLGGGQYEGFIHEMTSVLVNAHFADARLRDSIWFTNFSFSDALDYFKKYDRSLSDSDLLMLDSIADWAPYVRKTPAGFQINHPPTDSLGRQQFERRIAYMQKLSNFSSYLLFYCFSLEFDHKFKVIAALYPKGYFRDYLLGRFLFNQVFSTNLLFLDDKLLAYLKALFHDPLNYQIIESESRIHENKLRSDILENLLDASPEESTVLNKLARLHKGKVVYIDLWATWCGPCIRQFPYSKKLQEELKGKEVVFAYLCADSSPKEWKAAIKKHQLKGDHHLLTPDELLSLSGRYNFNGYPRYMIINSEGMLESANALSPQMEDALRTTLLYLLDEEVQSVTGR